MNISDWIRTALQHEEKELSTLCKRKRVIGIAIPPGRTDIGWIAAVNGPIGERECSGVKGGCGCLHTEPKLVMSIERAVADRRPTHLESGWTIYTEYSPCVPCAQIMAISGRIAEVRWKTFAPHHPDAPAILEAAGIRWKEWSP